MAADIERLKGLLEKATPELTNGKASVNAVERLLRAGFLGQKPRARNEPRYAEDAALIVAAVNALPNLLSSIEALQAENERLVRLEKTADDLAWHNARKLQTAEAERDALKARVEALESDLRGCMLAFESSSQSWYKGTIAAVFDKILQDHKARALLTPQGERA